MGLNGFIQYILSVEKIGLNETVEDCDKIQGEW